MWSNQLKTTVLLATLSGILMFVGSTFGGMRGLFIFTGLAFLMNLYAYYYSSVIVLRMYRATPLDKDTYGWVYAVVEELAHKEGLPMPLLWYIPLDMANAFATGRNPQNAHVGLTQGILDILDQQELRGVLAHELSHIKNRDILIGSVAATLATAIGFIANAMRYSAFYGGMPTGDQGRRGNPLALLLIVIFMPLAATLIRLAISRSREYLADESGAELSHDPLALAAALEKLHAHTKQAHFSQTATQFASTAHLFIVNPFAGGKLSQLFATHPPMQERVERLRDMYQRMHQGD